jgi:hypothetical protein
MMVSRAVKNRRYARQQQCVRLAASAFQMGQSGWVATCSSKSGTPFDELPFDQVLDASGDNREALGIGVLTSFASRLHERHLAGWYKTKVLPENTEWIGTTLGAYDGPSDWTEIDISVRSWRTQAAQGRSQRLWRLWATLDVACWCEPDHNIHRIQEVTFEVGSPAGLDQACASALSVLDGWIAEGLLPADSWRDRAGLPLRENK